MAFAGCRPSEVRALTGRDWQRSEAPMLVVREGLSRGVRVAHAKTGHRKIPVRPELLELLPARCKPADVLAPSALGREWSESGLDAMFTRVAARAGVADRHWSPYYLRHYCITRWLQERIPIHVVMRMAGHRRLSTTEIYTHHVAEDLVRVHELWAASAADHKTAPAQQASDDPPPRLR